MSRNDQFVKLPRELLESAAWQSQSINCRRLIDFLMVEHVRKDGRKNGELKAPRRQLIAAGIHAHIVSKAIEEAERAGVIECHRGTGRRANLYELTWLPLSNGTGPSNRWLESGSEDEQPIAAQKLAKARKQ